MIMEMVVVITSKVILRTNDTHLTFASGRIVGQVRGCVCNNGIRANVSIFDTDCLGNSSHGRKQLSSCEGKGADVSGPFTSGDRCW